MVKKSVKKFKVCSKCNFSGNPEKSKTCKECGSEKFEPEWIREKQSLTRNASVQITKSNPAYGKTEDRLTLYKWWPGGRATFHITKPGHWEQIKEIIDTKFLDILGWDTSSKIKDSLINGGNSEKKTAANSTLEQHPQILKEILNNVNIDSLSKNDFQSFSDTLIEISEILYGANAGFREAFLSVIKKLPRQKQRALEDLDNLLKNWELNIITNVSNHVKNRLDTIDLFEERVQDPKTLEISGDNSIHRILERAMWLVDEKYWLLISNKTVRKFIGDQLTKTDKKKYGNKRPDFVCGTIGDQLILLELKRPAHKLTIDDLNQLETYVTLAEKYKNFTSYKAYLVGSEISDDLKARMKHRSSNFKVLFYSDIIDNMRNRYKEFLDSID